MPKFPKLQCKRGILRMATEDDIDAILRYFIVNQDHLAPFEPIKPVEFYTPNFWRVLIRDRTHAFLNDQGIKFFLFDRHNPQQIIAAINFSNVVRGAFQSCTLGFSIADQYQGQGYMAESIPVAIAYLFSDLNLHRIMAAYMPHNQRSGRLLRRLGFQLEGYAPRYLCINGIWQDHMLTSLINTNI
ncbi:GNAT family N-acetyltransferase [Acaryochloris sp. 'Moss Beach']|uniref:GNAT family N-acetyltransferase n=1 Tax=Acaryochloris TaxID=155977 RepID=UPI001BAF2A35|nr:MULTISPECIES: GNAT family N-acetyltransferase [Acaryochloris]QUY42455.1 GNAT family N-acetyltransferase [Acaryochloris marina S15]UJB71545.1 GNAT family N-acetyltransferase [Acaryochloris sp. 'Moss Beach']